jgi:hypothetical protein
MTEREIDQLLVERVQRGDKEAYGILVAKYQRKLARLISRQCLLHLALPDWDQHCQELSRVARAAGADDDRAGC